MLSKCYWNIYSLSTGYSLFRNLWHSKCFSGESFLTRASFILKWNIKANFLQLLINYKNNKNSVLTLYCIFGNKDYKPDYYYVITYFIKNVIWQKNRNILVFHIMWGLEVYLNFSALIVKHLPTKKFMDDEHRRRRPST